MMFIASFPRPHSAGKSWAGPEEPGNIAKNTLVPYALIDTVVTSEINLYKQVHDCVLLGVHPQIQ